MGLGLRGGFLALVALGPLLRAAKAWEDPIQETRRFDVCADCGAQRELLLRDGLPQQVERDEGYEDWVIALLPQHFEHSWGVSQLWRKRGDAWSFGCTMDRLPHFATDWREHGPSEDLQARLVEWFESREP